MKPTACNTAGVVEEANRRWLGPPSFPLIEEGKSTFSITGMDQNMEQADLANETSSSCIPDKNNNLTHNINLLFSKIIGKVTRWWSAQGSIPIWKVKVL